MTSTPPDSDRLSDQAIAELAGRRLRESPYASIRRLSCEFQGGVLTVRGTLSSFYQKQLAQTVLRKIEGVRQIVNCVEVHQQQ